MKGSLKLLIIGFLLSIKIFASEPFILTEKTFSVGGSAAFLTRINLDSSVNLELNIRPNFSCIKFKLWEFGIQPTIDITIHRSVPLANRVAWGTDLYTRRYFSIRDNIYYYIGGIIGTRIFDLDFRSWKGVAGLQNGILFGLTKNIAMDFGLPVIVHLNRNTFFEYIEIPIGYFGVRAFF